MSVSQSRVALVETDDRKHGVKVSLTSLKLNPVKGKIDTNRTLSSVTHTIFFIFSFFLLFKIHVKQSSIRYDNGIITFSKRSTKRGNKEKLKTKLLNLHLSPEHLFPDYSPIQSY